MFTGLLFHLNALQFLAILIHPLLIILLSIGSPVTSSSRGMAHLRQSVLSDGLRLEIVLPISFTTTWLLFGTDTTLKNLMPGLTQVSM